MTLWIAVLEAEDGSWNDDPLTTDGTKAQAIDNAKAMWPSVNSGERVTIYRCEFAGVVDVPERTASTVSNDAHGS